MTLDLAALADLDVDDLSDEDAAALRAGLDELMAEDRKENAILYYRPVSRTAMAVHRSRAKKVGIFGGNRSSKTETAFAEAAMLSTGMWPAAMDEAMRPKFRGPRKVRVDVQSLTTTLPEAILPKLRWSSWNGYSEPGGAQGHYGWIPRACLIGGTWDKSWEAKTSTLRMHCRDPDDGHVLGESFWQFVSHNMDPADLASGEFDDVLHDEPVPASHWRENWMRVASRRGRCILMMTWSDDPSIPSEWIHDEVWEPGQAGPGKDPDVDVFVLKTIDNPNIDRKEIEERIAKADAVTVAVRYEGQPITFSNRIHPLFTDSPRVWSFPAGRVVEPTEAGLCPVTGSDNIVPFCHVGEFEHSRSWPTTYFLDPHPRKPHMMIWVQVDAADDLLVVAEAEVEGDAVDVFARVKKIERDMGLNVMDWWRWGDPNMLRTPTAKREVLWLDEFRNAGLNVSEADDSDVGRARINEYLKPDERTRRPRLLVHARCSGVTSQMRRFVWDSYRKQDERDVKQVPKPKNDDYPACLRYCLNTDPTFHFLTHGAPVIRRGRSR